MATTRFPYTSELAPFQAAHDAWERELARVYGNNTAAAKWDESRRRGREGSKLRQLHEACETARSAWHLSAYQAA